jgi:hypothetical protein
LVCRRSASASTEWDGAVGDEFDGAVYNEWDGAVHNEWDGAVDSEYPDSEYSDTEYPEPDLSEPMGSAAPADLYEDLSTCGRVMWEMRLQVATPNGMWRGLAESITVCNSMSRFGRSSTKKKRMHISKLWSVRRE